MTSLPTKSTCSHSSSYDPPPPSQVFHGLFPTPSRGCADEGPPYTSPDLHDNKKVHYQSTRRHPKYLAPDRRDPGKWVLRSGRVPFHLKTSRFCVPLFEWLPCCRPVEQPMSDFDDVDTLMPPG